ncbi:hypothetical protein CBR_g38696 [Chara braunii]|uniref:Uncharacterized protein n=1 Tax=Chara braunii TaxID=69332 RepID=A0A388LQD6_CHABU|nr:hypothetical protein CBR_g38696 [Chara braunii]|eukprot:GBG84412.1 hypothetical protein CBR_g38696 [Chara braunii]
MDFVEGAKDTLDDDILVHASIADVLAMKEKTFVDLWGAKSAFHNGLVNAPVTEAFESDSDSDGLDLTEEEKQFHAAEIAKTERDRGRGMAKDKRLSVSKFLRNAFLPLAPSRWVESESVRLDYKVWELDTFNHYAPIDANVYHLLASLTEAEMTLCQDKALGEDTDLIKGPYPIGTEAMAPPMVGHFDHTKCSASGSQLQIRSFCATRAPDVISELKRIWNVGRPFLKCRCVEEGKEDCKTSITWFDHVLWYLLANLEYLYLIAPSLRARIRAMRNFLKRTWRAPILTSVVFTHMRTIMTQMAENVVLDLNRRRETIHDDPVVMARKFPRRMAALILPDKYIRSPARRRKGKEVDNRPAKRQSNTLLKYYVRPGMANEAQNEQQAAAQQLHGSVSPNESSKGNAAMDTPHSSSVTVQSAQGSSVVGRQLRRSPRATTARTNLFSV